MVWQEVPGLEQWERCRRMNHTVDLDPEAKKELLALSPGPREEVNKVLRRLRAGPDHTLDLRLQNQERMWRAKAGRRWRVVYDVGPGRHIQVKRIRRRHDAYRGIEHPGSHEVGELAVPYSERETSVSAAAAD